MAPFPHQIIHRINLESTGLSSQPFTDLESIAAEEIMEVNLRQGVSADQAKVHLGRIIQLLGGGKQAVNKLPEGKASPLLLDFLLSIIQQILYGVRTLLSGKNAISNKCNRLPHSVK